MFIFTSPDDVTVATTPRTQKHTHIKKGNLDTIYVSSMQCAVRDLGCQTVYRLSTSVYLYYTCNILNSKLDYGKTKEIIMFVSLYFVSKTFLRLRSFSGMKMEAGFCSEKNGENVRNCALLLMIFCCLQDVKDLFLFLGK